MEYINFEHNETAAELVRAAYDTPPLAFVHSYGCQQNVNDGERIKGVLVDIGYGLCDKPEDADLILFNTCAVREHAEQRVFGNVGALKGLKEKKRRPDDRPVRLHGQPEACGGKAAQELSLCRSGLWRGWHRYPCPSSLLRSCRSISAC